MLLLITVLLVALAFEYINGFHDTANSIAMGVSTKALTPRLAIIIAATTNLAGALVGTAVAKTITKGLVDAQFVTTTTIITALLGAIIWNLITWWFGLPSSSSHALVGGLCGATLASSGGNWSSIIWAKGGGAHWWDNTGILYKVVAPMLISPVLGFCGGLFVMSLLYVLLRNWRPATVTRRFKMLQMFSGSYMGFSHGSNDAQKTMGIIALALAAAVKAGTLDQVPGWLEFLRHPMVMTGDGKEVIAPWIKVLCALVMAAGTSAGGWRIIRTMGQKMVKVLPVNGFAADFTAATVLMSAAHFGMPVSTTHAVTTSIMGVGCAKRFNALKFSVVERILWAWVLTLPLTGLLGYLLMEAAKLF